MKTDDLERDLTALAEPHAGDEQLRVAIRATLAQQPQGRTTIRRRNRRLFGSAAVAAATLAAVIVALIGTGGSGPSAANAAILRHVVRAMSPPADTIVHVKEVGALADGTQVGAEWWQETNQPYAGRLIKGPIGQEGEAAFDGTTASQYDAASNTIYQTADSTPTLIDPVVSVRAALESGTAQVAGTATIDGQILYKIELPRVVGYFDRTDYRPAYLDNVQHDGSIVRTRVIAYEELPSTPENETLVSIAAQHPGASVATGTAPTPPKS